MKTCSNVSDQLSVKRGANVLQLAQLSSKSFPRVVEFLGLLIFAAFYGMPAWSRVDRDWRTYEDSGSGEGGAFVGWFFLSVVAYVVLKEQFSKSAARGAIAITVVFVFLVVCYFSPWLLSMVPKIGIWLLIFAMIVTIFDRN